MAEKLEAPQPHPQALSDAARQMYYEQYLAQRDKSLQQSANTGGRVSVEIDVEGQVVKRQAGSEGEPARTAAAPEAAEPQDTASNNEAGNYANLGFFIQQLGIAPKDPVRGAGYTRRRRQAPVDPAMLAMLDHTSVMEKPDQGLNEVRDSGHAELGALLREAVPGLKAQAPAVDPSYGR